MSIKPTKIELVPGVYVATTDEPELTEEELEAQRNAAERAALAHEMTERRKHEIITSVQRDLSEGNRIEITEEMVELKLDTQVREMTQKAEHHWKIWRHLYHEED